jgi:hypothetical protein
MKNISTGTGLCVLGLCLASYPIIDRVMPRAEAGATHVASVVAAAMAQVPPEPTIVWYGTSSSAAGSGYQIMAVVFRAWSDGKIEFKQMLPGTNSCASSVCPNWQVLSDANSGFNASADVNFDSKVDGADLGQVLAMWGDAPRQDIPPSICPLNLINP